jgi:hypothetical protein
MASRLFGLTVLLLLLSQSLPVSASHYPMEVVPFLEAGHRAKLAALKVEDTEELLQALLTSEARKKAARKTGIEVAKLEEYSKLCDLLRIRGVGPKMARLLLLSGISGLAGLRGERGGELIVKMRATNKQHGVSEILPQVETLKDWIHQARALDIILK